MRVGFTLYTNPAEQLAAICRHAEQVGFRHVWCGEHVVAPVSDHLEHPYGGRQRPPVVVSDDRFYDIWVAIGAILASTQTLQVATGVYIAPLRNPLLTARACLTAQRMAGGRFVFGLGTGWLAEEFAAIGIPFAERGSRTAEIMQILRRLFAGETFAHEGAHYRFPQLQMSPVPMRIPMIVGGTRGPAMRRAARLADGWVGVPIPLEESIAVRDDIMRLRRDEAIAGDFAFYPRLTGGEDRDAVARYRDAGFENLVITWDMLHPEDPRSTSLEQKYRRLEQFAARIGVAP